MHVALGLCPGSVPVVGAACTAVSGAAGKVAGAGVDAVFSAASTWVSSGAVWLLGEVGHVLSATTSVDLSAPWFAAHEAFMATLAAAVVLPMTCCAVIQAVYRQSASMLLRIFLVNLPLCLVFTGVAVTLVRLGLAITDELSAQVLSGAGVDTTNLFSGLTVFFAGTAVSPAVPTFVVFVGALLVALAALVLWLELVVRAAAVTAAVLFLPLAMAALVWPAVSHWCRRLADTLVALVLSKLVVAAVLSLAAGALAGGLGLSGSGGGGFAAVVTGIALLVIATMSPFTLLRLVPAVEAGAVAHLESTRHRLQSAARAPIRTGGNLALDLARGHGGSALGAEAGDGAGGAAVGAVDGGASAIPMVAGTEVGPEVAVALGTGGAGAGAAAGGGAAAGAAPPGAGAPAGGASDGAGGPSPPDHRGGPAIERAGAIGPAEGAQGRPPGGVDGRAGAGPGGLGGPPPPDGRHAGA